MSFGRFLLDEGVEMELGADLSEVVALLDREIPKFEYEGYGYRISSSKGIAGSQWRFLVKPWDTTSACELESAVGLVEVYGLEDGSTSLRVPPRYNWADEWTKAFDEEGRFFTSFVSQLLNALSSEGLVKLPGQLPVR